MDRNELLDARRSVTEEIPVLEDRLLDAKDDGDNDTKREVATRLRACRRVARTDPSDQAALIDALDALRNLDSDDNDEQEA